ncbi:unnamed protein product, partial [Sphenostylis stenocarpa]
VVNLITRGASYLGDAKRRVVGELGICNRKDELLAAARFRSYGFIVGDGDTKLFGPIETNGVAAR